MADQGTRLLDLVVKGNVANTDRIVAIWNAGANTAQTVTISVSTLLSALLPVLPDPANSTSMTIPAGGAFRSNNFLYVATANNYVKRATLSDF
jgi:hypothetical protein